MLNKENRISITEMIEDNNKFKKYMVNRLHNIFINKMIV